VSATALLSADLVASKPVADPDHPEETVDEATPYALAPASAEPVADRVSIGEALGDDVAVDRDPDGDVYFVTVQEPAQSVLSWWVARSEPEIDFTTYDEKYPGGQTPTEQRTEQLRMMATSSQVAQYVALERAGYPVEVVSEVAVAGPACVQVNDAGDRCEEWMELRPELQENDTIVSVDGTPVDSGNALGEVLTGAEPGDEVTLVIERPDEGTVEVTLELLESPIDPGRGIIGIQPVDVVSLDLPFELTIDTGRIGGPSAGLAFTLTLLDELTAGDLLGGLDVAVTGSINLDGTVGAIGGLAQKASAVRQAGLHHFLVPASQSADELADAQAIAGDDVELIGVATLDEAVAALQRLGGAALPDVAPDTVVPPSTTA
jgi:PDZ domain-containing protein